MTKDEIYLLRLFKLAKALGGPCEEVDRYAVGKAMGQNDKSVDNIVKLLAQTNFIKKGDENNIYLTDQGKALVDTLTNS